MELAQPLLTAQKVIYIRKSFIVKDRMSSEAIARRKDGTKVAARLERLAMERKDWDTTQKNHILKEALRKYEEAGEAKAVERVSAAIKSNSNSKNLNDQPKVREPSSSRWEMPWWVKIFSTGRENIGTVEQRKKIIFDSNMHFAMASEFRAEGLYEEAAKHYEVSTDLHFKVFGDDSQLYSRIKEALEMRIAAARQAQEDNDLHSARRNLEIASKKSKQYRENRYLKLISSRLREIDDAEKQSRMRG